MSKLIAILGVVLTLVHGHVAAQAPLGPELLSLPLGAALNTVADRVDSSIERAGAVANGVAIRAGSEVNAAINNMRVAYADMLNQTVQTLAVEIRNQLAQVASDAAALEARTAEDAERIAALAQQTANVLPFANRRPQVTRVDPVFEVYSAAATASAMTMSVSGNFANAAEPGLRPHLVAAGQKLDPVRVTTQNLMFSLPRSVIKIPEGRVTSAAKLMLVIPYKERRLLASRVRQAQFPMLLTGIPASPGRITVETRVPFSSTARRHVVSPQFNLQSDRDDHVQVVCGPNETSPIDPTTVRVVFDRTEGDTWTHRPERLNNPSVCYWFRTEHHRFGTSDKLWWHYEYDVTDTVNGERTGSDTFELGWGDSRVIPVSAGQFTVRFDAFDGSRGEFSAANHGNRFIVVATEGGGLRIAARPVSGILPVSR